MSLSRFTTAVLTALFLLSACGHTTSVPARNDGLRGTKLDGLYTLPDAVLTDVVGQPYRLRSAEAKLTVVFFGYTNCPDVCTGIATDLAAALLRMDETKRKHIRVLLITTDPARDTSAVLKDYLGRIQPSFIGLTGGIAEIKKIAESVGVEISDGKKLPNGGYEVTHGTQILSFDPQWKALVVWTQGASIGDLKHDMEILVGR